MAASEEEGALGRYSTHCIEFECGICDGWAFQQFPFGLKFFRAEKRTTEKSIETDSKAKRETHTHTVSLKEKDTQFILFLSLLSLDNKKKKVGVIPELPHMCAQVMRQVTLSQIHRNDFDAL